MDFLVITDPHLTATSNVRTDEDYCSTIIKKLSFVVDCANKWNASILCAGDLFDKPSVPDFVKLEFIKVVNRLKGGTFYTIRSNHDTLFNNHSMDYKTSLQLLHEAGIIRYLRDEEVILSEGDLKLRLVNKRLVKDAGIPTIILYHGFLNKEDGPNTFLFEDIPENDNCVVCLGHDHVPYEPVTYNNSIIFRIGSLVRAIRNDSEKRIPQMLRIRLKSDGNFIAKLYDVPCIDSSLIFKEKKVKSRLNVEKDYTELLESLKGTKNMDMSLCEALKLVAPIEVVSYVDSILVDYENSLKSK